jgi:hypothetical protein
MVCHSPGENGKAALKLLKGWVRKGAEIAGRETGGWHGNNAVGK